MLIRSAELVFQWRQKIIELLEFPIESEVEDIDPVTGTKVVNPEDEHYAKSLKAQGDVEAYLTAYAAAVADRRGEWSVAVVCESESRLTSRVPVRGAKSARHARRASDEAARDQSCSTSSSRRRSHAR